MFPLLVSHDSNVTCFSASIGQASWPASSPSIHIRILGSISVVRFLTNAETFRKCLMLWLLFRSQHGTNLRIHIQLSIRWCLISLYRVDGILLANTKKDTIHTEAGPRFRGILEGTSHDAPSDLDAIVWNVIERPAIAQIDVLTAISCSTFLLSHSGG